MKILDIMEIKRLLGMEYPMFMIDKVLDLEPMKTCHAIKNVTYNEWFFPAHYPQRPVMPGTLQMEALSQAAVLTVLSGGVHKCDIPLFAGMDKCRFYKPVLPGSCLEIFATIDRFVMGVSQASVKGIVNGEIVCEAKITHKIPDWEE